MECQFTDGLTSNDNSDSGIGNFFDNLDELLLKNYLFELDFFAFGKVEHFFCVMKENSAFRFRLTDVDGAGEYSHLCILCFLDDAYSEGVVG